MVGRRLGGRSDSPRTRGVSNLRDMQEVLKAEEIDKGTKTFTTQGTRRDRIKIGLLPRGKVEEKSWGSYLQAA